MDVQGPSKLYSSVRLASAPNNTENAKLVASVEYLQRVNSIVEQKMRKSRSNFKQAQRFALSELTPSLVERQVIAKGALDCL